MKPDPARHDPIVAIFVVSCQSDENRMPTANGSATFNAGSMPAAHDEDVRLSHVALPCMPGALPSTVHRFRPDSRAKFRA